jgi:hypothetical protein
VRSGFAQESPYADEWLKRGWADREALEHIGAAWEEWAQKPGAFAVVTRCEAMGWKE